MKLVTSKRFEALDGLRGVAALVVMFGHFGQILGTYSPTNMFVAVDAFFALSGFVVAYSYTEKLKQGMSPWKYFYRRLVRNYPPPCHVSECLNPCAHGPG
jgi:peptidoglycan/LPS O-acetylase OafA/YrhL